MQFSLIYITTKDKAEGQAIARALVESRLAACANIFDNMEAIYWWGDELVETGECVVIAKTRSELVHELVDRVKELHSYNAPCIVAMPIQAGNPAFLNWIKSETRPATKPGPELGDDAE